MICSSKGRQYSLYQGKHHKPMSKSVIRFTKSCTNKVMRDVILSVKMVKFLTLKIEKQNTVL